MSDNHKAIMAARRAIAMRHYDEALRLARTVTLPLDDLATMEARLMLAELEAAIGEARATQDAIAQLGAVLCGAPDA